MNSIVSFSKYYNEYLAYFKTISLNGKIYKTSIKLNRRQNTPYYIELIKNKFKSNETNLEALGDYLLNNDLKFQLFLPLKNTKGYYVKNLPDTESYMDAYHFDDEKSLRIKRPVTDYEYIDIFNNQIIGVFENKKF